MDQEKKNLIVTMADANFVNQAKQLFSSVFFNAAWPGDYLLLAYGLLEKDLNWFKEKGILVYEQPLLANSLLGVMSYPPIVLSKFYLFKEYFKQWDKIIFLDADIIVRGSLDYLIKLDGFNAPKIKTFWLKDEFYNDDNNKLVELREKYPFKGRPFSTGVMVFNTDIIKTSTYKEIINLYYNYKDLYKYQEESTLNLYFYKKWQPLPLIYNLIPSELNRLYGLNKNKVLAYIIHFPCAIIKPWNLKSDYYEEWSYNLKKADEINLDFRPRGAKTYSDQELNRYLRFITTRKIICFLRPTYFFIDRQVGLVGLFIKKKNPKLYNLISLKNDKR